jgi:hypothetical protein
LNDGLGTEQEIVALGIKGRSAVYD